ncbi:MAG: hypothetical protein OXF41_08950 [bacterium]|nr:hypothetical protein [bacterium]
MTSRRRLKEGDALVEVVSEGAELPVVVVSVAEHLGLQHVVDSLFPSVDRTPLEQENGDALVLETVPNVAQLGGIDPTATARSISRPPRAKASRLRNSIRTR